jgi:hypothetical protein
LFINVVPDKKKVMNHIIDDNVVGSSLDLLITLRKIIRVRNNSIASIINTATDKITILVVFIFILI